MNAQAHGTRPCSRLAACIDNPHETETRRISLKSKHVRAFACTETNHKQKKKHTHTTHTTTHITPQLCSIPDAIQSAPRCLI